MTPIRRQNWIARIVVTLAAIALFAILLFDVIGVGSIEPPPAAPIQELLILDQNWGSKAADWFHHASQGTRIMRYDWFMALEQPKIRMLTVPVLLHESDYLQRFGFLPDDRPTSYGGGLPIGFAVEDHFQEPARLRPERGEATGSYIAPAPYRVVGLTCAACHTGQINYRGKGLRIEGGPAMIDLGGFQDAVRRALAYTVYVPGRFDRFAHRALGKNYSSAARADLWAELNRLIAAGLQDKKYADSKHLYDLKAGYGRTDALGLIGNRAFQDLNTKDNLAMADAPVNFPPLWDTSWFDWVQYNASIRPPMVRNIGEALGVGALVVTDELAGELYDSTVNVENIHRMEQQIAGPKPFEGLQSPAWPITVLGEFDSFKLESGRRLFASHCKSCHPTVEDLKLSLLEEPSRQTDWVPADPTATTSGNDLRLIRLRTHNLQFIGTDPAQALNLHKRVVFRRQGAVPEGIALLKVTAEIRNRKYAELQLTPEQEREFDGYRPMPKGNLTDPNVASSAIAANLAYRPRPLNGVWATAPYLHNGSVPNLYELLLPAADRSRRFTVGGREFDPINVGYVASQGVGVFEFDTSIPGNLNQGHEFRNLTLEELESAQPADSPLPLRATQSQRWARVLGISEGEFQWLSEADRQRRIRRASQQELAHVRAKGVLGPEFTDEERWALIEYLKSL